MYPKAPRALFWLLRHLIYRCGRDSHLGEWVDGEILNIGMIRYAGPNRTYSWLYGYHSLHIKEKKHKTVSPWTYVTVGD